MPTTRLVRHRTHESLLVREVRSLAGLSRRKLARRAGLKPHTAGDIEAGRRPPTWRSMRAIAAAVGGVLVLELRDGLADWVAHPASQGEAVRMARRRAGLTQLQLCARTGVLQHVLSGYETGQWPGRPDTIRRMIEACGVGFYLRIIPASS